MAGMIRVTYLCFSDFSTAVSRIQDGKQFDLIAAFKGRGPVSIPAALGLGNIFKACRKSFLAAITTSRCQT